MITPSSISEFEGNTRLKSLLSKGSLPHSSLFTGPDGIGKKTLAVLLAALANCRGKSRETGDICGNCSSCLKALSGNHPDIYLYASESKDGSRGDSIKIEDMRNLRKEARYRPYEGKLRFFIVDEAEKMTEEAANCILKVLEEPPATTRIVLVTAFPGLLLPTILSRCQAFRFQRLDTDSVLRLLGSRPDLENRELRASFSGGSFGRALEIDVDDVREKRDALIELFSLFLERRSFSSVYYQSQKKPFKSLVKSKAEVEELLELLTELCHDIYSVKSENPERIVHKDRIEKLEGLSRKLSLDSLQTILYHIRQAVQDLNRNVSPQICFETLWLPLQKMD